MTDKSVSGLVDVSPIASGDLAYVVRSGNSRRANLGNAAGTDTGRYLSDSGTFLSDSGAFLSDSIITAQGRNFLDDTGQTGQRRTIGLDTGDSPQFTNVTLKGGQLAFPATQLPSLDANTLDDYEEGIWTPALTFATPGNLSVAYSEQGGTYTKIGRLVFVTFRITTSTFTHTTASGNCRVDGLPFTSAADFYHLGALDWQGITKASYTQVSARIIAASSSVFFATSGSGQTATTITAADMPTAGTVILRSSLFYFV